MSTKNILKPLLFAVIQGIILLFFVLQAYTLPFTKEVESVIFKVLTGSKRLLFDGDDKPASNSIVFVNTSKAVVIDKEGGQMTDRTQLLKFIKILANQPSFKFAFFDVLMHDHTSVDSSLLSEALKLPGKILFIKSTDEAGRMVEPFDLRLPAAAADFYTNQGVALQFPLVMKVTGGDYLASPTAPLRIFQQLYPPCPVQLTALVPGLVYINDHLNLANPVVELRMRPADVIGEANQPALFACFELTQFLKVLATPGAADQYLKNKLIIVGNLDPESKLDTHESLLGKTLGSLLIVNTYLMIEKGETKINWVWLLLLCAVFFTASFINIDLFLYRRHERYPWLERLQRLRENKERSIRSKGLRILLGLASWFGVFVLLLTISYFFFHILFHFIFIALFMEAEMILFTYYRRST